MHPDTQGQLSDLGEFGLIDRIRSHFRTPSDAIGIGDDCAVLHQQNGRDTLVSTDMLIEGTHFLREDIAPYDLGWKSAAVNLSDIAAMGGQPTGTFLSLALPASLNTGWVEQFLNGYADISGRFGAGLLGGDTTASPDRICINVAILGECPSGNARLRSAAMDTDLVCVTGALGDSAAGLKAILEGVERDADVRLLIGRHYRPVPRIAEGLELSANPCVHAMMDISDGIGSDLEHILEASGCVAEIDLDAIPLSVVLKRICKRYGWDPLEFARCGGEDYELLFTCTRQAERVLTTPHFVIGRIHSGSPGHGRRIIWRGDSDAVADRLADASGFDHFKKR